MAPMLQLTIGCDGRHWNCYPKSNNYDHAIAQRALPLPLASAASGSRTLPSARRLLLPLVQVLTNTRPHTHMPSRSRHHRATPCCHKISSCRFEISSTSRLLLSHSHTLLHISSLSLSRSHSHSQPWTSCRSPVN
jgi:hypothetical protein